MATDDRLRRRASAPPGHGGRPSPPSPRHPSGHRAGRLPTNVQVLSGPGGTGVGHIDLGLDGSTDESCMGGVDVSPIDRHPRTA